MAYTKDYYHILGLGAPSWGSSKQVSPAELRRAYKLALLAAHPDKKAKQKDNDNDNDGGAGHTNDDDDDDYTVDDVKEAYGVLATEPNRTEYTAWLLRHGSPVATHNAPPSTALDSDFVLGLEVLDLADFEECTSSGLVEGEDGGKGVEGQMQMQWTRPCRCGDEHGFRILEEELEGAEGRGER